MRWPSGLERSTVTDFLPRLAQAKYADSPVSLPAASFSHGGPNARESSPAPGRSTLITSAPRSARFCPHHGPASTRDKSSTLICDSGPAIPLTPIRTAKAPRRQHNASLWLDIPRFLATWRLGGSSSYELRLFFLRKRIHADAIVLGREISEILLDLGRRERHGLRREPAHEALVPAVHEWRPLGDAARAGIGLPLQLRIGEHPRQQALGERFPGTPHASLDQDLQGHCATGEGQERRQLVVGDREAQAVDGHSQ